MFCLLFDWNLQDVEELVGLAPEKLLLKWMNFHLKKAGYTKQVTNFSSDVKVRKFNDFSMPKYFVFCSYTVSGVLTLRDFVSKSFVEH